MSDQQWFHQQYLFRLKSIIDNIQEDMRNTNWFIGLCKQVNKEVQEYTEMWKCGLFNSLEETV